MENSIENSSEDPPICATNGLFNDPLKNAVVLWNGSHVGLIGKVRYDTENLIVQR